MASSASTSNLVKLPRKLRLFSPPSQNGQSSEQFSSSASSFQSEFSESHNLSHFTLHNIDPMFSEETEQRINEWLDEQNIQQIQPEQHFRDYFQQTKDLVSQQLFLMNILADSGNNNNNVNNNHNTNSDDAKSDSSLMTSSTGSLDLKKSPILARRCITLCDPNMRSSLIRK